MNGQERAEQNFLAFQTWATAKTDADFREMVMQGRLKVMMYYDAFIHRKNLTL